MDNQERLIKSESSSKALTVIMLLSGSVLLFLFWLVYFKERTSYSSDLISSLPALNALFNTISATLLSLGYIYIKKGRRRTHMKLMISAFISSSLFLVGYIIYHTFHGDTRFTGTGIIRPVYFVVLITHILLSAVVVPMILSSFYFALSGKFATHRKISRFTFPVWMYVSVTGVLIFALLRLFS
jgi:putative membrane protein